MSSEKSQVNEYPTSTGYLVVDSKRCQGCLSCMMVCSLVHEGEANLSLSRIQVMQNILKDWPDDIKISQCRQCVDPPCVEACPTGALHVDPASDNVRTIDQSECTGCESCMEACPYTPKRIIFNSKTGVAVKCDLCFNTTYWAGNGGTMGKHACIEVCPQQCIKFTTEIPEQRGEAGYDANLREATR